MPPADSAPGVGLAYPQVWTALWNAQIEGRLDQVGNAQHLWTTCRETLRTQVSDAVWRSTFQDIAELGIDGDTLRLAVPSAMVRDRVEGRYLSLVEDVVRDLGGRDLAITLDVRPDAAPDVTEVDPAGERLGARP
jgi:hypothetical protein